MLSSFLILGILYPAVSFAAAPTVSGSVINWTSAGKVSSVASSSAKLGATISSNGGEALTERGIVWNTTGAPTIAGNKIVEGGTAAGAFTVNATGLPAATLIYFRGYATNASGTSYSEETTFYTEPAAQAGAPTIDDPSGTDYFDLTVNYTVPAGAAGVLVVARIDSGQSVKAPYDGTEYTADARYTNASPTVPGCFLYCSYVVAKDTADGSVNVTGLRPNISYVFAVYAYNGSGSGISGINYVQEGAVAVAKATDSDGGISHNQKYVPGFNTEEECAYCHSAHHTSQHLPRGLDQWDKCSFCHRAGGLASAKPNIGLHLSDGSVDCGMCHSMHSWRTEELYSTNNRTGVKGFNKSFVRANMSKYVNPDDFTPPSGGSITALNNTVFQNKPGDFAFATVDPVTGNYNGVCQSCHLSLPAPSAVNHYNQTTADGHRAGLNCAICHVHKQADQSNAFKPGHQSGGVYTDFGSDPECTGCHDITNGVLDGVHGNGQIATCSLCHSGEPTRDNEKLGDSITASGKSPAGDARLANGTAVASSWSAKTCLTCHAGLYHGITIAAVAARHQLASNSSRGYDCEGCHAADKANAQLTTHMKVDAAANCVSVCHGRTAASGASGIVAKTVIDDVTFNDPEPNLDSTRCEYCHVRKGDFRLHGMTDDDSVDDGIDNSNGPNGTSGLAIHNNLGSARGSWADSGGTVPSTRAAGYTGKINVASALIDDDYNCADCHDAERTGFTSLEAMRVHTFLHGSGRGSCLTCHTTVMVADEIDAGKGATGTAVECEDCHSMANGNGPSGEKMYQYDGVRHHKTIHAQSGNCTRCHADPRPADLSAEPGFAGTAAVNDGSDSDGITWDDGFDDDFGINNPNPRPTQMGCRLCHTNYETYTVDVRAEIDSNWDTTELSDKHGYNKTPPAHGLTVYADDYDARGTSLTFLDRDNALGVFENALKIRGAKQTTQVAIPSHRIEANDGTSKIAVYNYGACLACHTVQIRHAAPVPAADYDTPIRLVTDAARNTHPYDALRYSPGRSVFNDFRGTGGDYWNDHRKAWGWLAFNDSGRRGNRIFWNIGSSWNWDSVGNYSPNTLVTIPVTANLNKLEGFPATATSTIRNFDIGPTAPVIDDIFISVAQWTGSAVYVEATSTLGSAQDFSFTYSGAGGPCNTSMTWDTDHYEGLCIAASGWTATDTVTVYNNTTSAADEESRPLTDLTINPVTPVLTSISLADNNDSDPAPAEAGYTNRQSITVTLDTSNYPTFLMLAEDPFFSTNSTGWVAFDTPYTYTLTAGDGSKTVYAKVMNGAGESGSQSTSIVLDTTDPGVQADALTAPNGHTDPALAEFWTRNTDQTITWTTGGISDTNLKTNPIFLRYSPDSKATWPLTVASEEANDGSHAWTVTPALTYHARIRLAARDKAGNEGWDDSDNDFNISPLYIVTNTNDSGANSLRQVLTDVLAGGGNKTVWFNIPPTDPFFVNGVAFINVLTTDLPTIDQPNIILDGGSQTALRGDTNPFGPELRINDGDARVNGFNITGSSVAIKDMQITGFTTGINSTGSGTTLENNFLGFRSNNSTGFASIANGTNAILAGPSPSVTSNYLACATDTGLNLSGSSNADVDGNIFGRFPSGTSCPNTNSAIRIGTTAADALIQKNVISGSTYGIYLNGTSTRAIIRTNQIGAVYSGGTWTDLPGPTYGIYMDSNGTGGHTIGGGLAATSDDTLNDSDSNVIAASDTGIYIYQAEYYTNKIHGNFIGTNPGQDEVFAGNTGILARYVWGVTIGGSGANEAGNVIANMNSYGYSVYSDGTGARYNGLRRNSFFSNGDDTGDDAIYLSTGGHDSISRPTINSLDASTITVGGVYGGNGSNQNGDIVEVYKAQFDGSEYGEGKTFLTSAVVPFGQTTVNIDISGLGLNIGDWLTVTRTNHWPAMPAYATSAFSGHMRIPGPAAPTLDWTGETNYTTDGVNPDSTLSGSSFTFRVKFTDIDNDSPSTVQVWVDINNNGSFEANEKYSMTGVNPADTVYSDGKDYTFSLPVGKVLDGLHDYRFYASDGASAATGAPTANKTLTVQACTNDLSVNPAGTYFEAENYLVTLPQGSATFTLGAFQAPFNGVGYLMGNGTTSLLTPPTEQGKLYQLNFPATGSYTIWVRALGTSSTTRSVFAGYDGAWSGAVTTDFTYWSWIWTKATLAGSSTITIGTAGDHTFNIWVRENGFMIDAFYVTQGAETPTDATVPSGAKVINPSVCTP